MRNQYFGDERDFHKYSLLLDLVAHYSQLTNIVMMTPDDSSKEGRKRNFLPGDRPDLYEFLKTNREVKSLCNFFGGRDFAYHHYDRPFAHESRGNYFSSIPINWLHDAVVFLDPDVGVEDDRAYTKRKGFDKYVLYPEIMALWERMKDSCLVVYQHLVLDKTKQINLLNKKTERLQEMLPVKTIHKGDIAFFIIGYDKGQQEFPAGP